MPRRLPMPRTAGLLVVAAVLLGDAAFREAPPPGAELVAADPTRYPPPDRDRLAEALDDLLAEHDVVLQRASLIESPDNYSVSAMGTHLALYLEPARSATVDDYVDGLVTLTRTFGEHVLARWPELESFDICHMPPDGEPVSDDVPFTLIDISRERFETFLAEGGDLGWLLAGASRDELTTYLTEPVRDHPEVVQAAADAGVEIPEWPG